MLWPAISAAAIVPSWRINPISQAAIDDSEGLLEHALSVSLMVELSGTSQFGVVGMCLDGAYAAVYGDHAPSLRFYQRLGNGASNDDRPPPENFPAHPALEFDTYVANATTLPGHPAAVPGNYCGTGTASARIGTMGVFSIGGRNQQEPASTSPGPQRLPRAS